jgi:long-chain acyl-CoA synthetase
VTGAERTVPGVLWERGVATPSRLALLENTRGHWRVVSTGELAGDVGALAVALVERGVADGVRVALLLGTSAAWLTLDLAVQAAGGVAVAVPDDGDDESLAERLDGLGVAAAVVDDPVVLQRLEGLVESGRLDPIAQIWQRGKGDGRTDGLDDLLARGRELMAADAERVDRLWSAPAGRPAAVTYTAGASDHPRPVTHSGTTLLRAAEQVASARRLGPDDVGVVALDASHPFERSVTLYPAVVSGAVLAFPENASTVSRALLEIQPTFIHVSADGVRETAAAVVERFAGNRGIKRLVARRWRRTVREGNRPSSWSRPFVANRVRRTLGLANLRSLVVTSAPVPGHAVAVLDSLGVDIESGYAVLEAGGLVAVGAPGGRFRPLAGTTVGARDGILVVEGSAAVTITDDRGDVDGGTFEVRGPDASALEVGGGERLATEVEAALRESPYLLAALASAGDDGIHALVEVDRLAVGAWAARRGHHFTTLSSLVAIDEVRALIAGEVARLAPDVTSHELLQRRLQQGAEITRTRTTVHRRDPAPSRPIPPTRSESTRQQPEPSRRTP